MTPSIINILTAELVGDYQVRIRFERDSLPLGQREASPKGDDATEQTVDFKRFLTDSAHPDIRAWLDPDRFSGFRIEYGELVWGDYEMCFPMIDLYRNKIDHRKSLEAVA
jgi:hypothetical protein